MQLILYKLHLNYCGDMNLMLKNIVVKSSGMLNLTCVGKIVMNSNFTYVTFHISSQGTGFIDISNDNKYYLSNSQYVLSKHCAKGLMCNNSCNLS